MSEATGPDEVSTGSPRREVCRGSTGRGGGVFKRAIAMQMRSYQLAAGLSVADMAHRVGVQGHAVQDRERADLVHPQHPRQVGRRPRRPGDGPLKGVGDEREADYVPAGHGGQIVRRGSRQGHHYELLGGLRGPHNRREAVLVTLTESSQVVPLFQHPGTEILFMLESALVYGQINARYAMCPGMPCSSTAKGSTARGADIPAGALPGRHRVRGPVERIVSGRAPRG